MHKEIERHVKHHWGRRKEYWKQIEPPKKGLGKYLGWALIGIGILVLLNLLGGVLAFLGATIIFFLQIIGVVIIIFAILSGLGHIKKK